MKKGNAFFLFWVWLKWGGGENLNLYIDKKPKSDSSKNSPLCGPRKDVQRTREVMANMGVANGIGGEEGGIGQRVWGGGFRGFRGMGRGKVFYTTGFKHSCHSKTAGKGGSLLKIAGGPPAWVSKGV